MRIALRVVEVLAWVMLVFAAVGYFIIEAIRWTPIVLVSLILGCAFIYMIFASLVAIIRNIV